MNQSTLFLMFAIFIAVAEATQHTSCFNYFYKKDGCVYSSADNRTRCPAPPKNHTAPIPAFSLVSQDNKKQKKSPPHLVRRYDATVPSFPVGGGNGTCGFYNSTTEIGVCLWSGAEQVNPTAATAGWLDGPKTSNCHKRVYIQRTGYPGTVQYAKVLDGCGFNTVKLDVGCFQIGVTIALFNKFNPSPDEQKHQLLFGGLTWDFDNLNGISTQQAPV